MMKVLVTGGAGFIGYHVAKKFLDQGNEVLIYDNFSTGSRKNTDDLEKEFGKKIKVVEANISDYVKLKSVCADVGFIVHLAAVVSVPQSVKNPQETNIVTLGGTINVFELAKEIGVKKIIQASSAAVYGNPKKVPVSETFLVDPISPYGIAKYAGELYAKSYKQLFGIDSVSLRFFNIYGERQDPSSPYSGVISKFVSFFSDNQEINIFGNGKNSRDFVYVEDLANIIYKIFKTNFSGSRVYNVGTGKSEQLNSVVKILEKIYKRKIQVNYLPRRVGDIIDSRANISKIKKDFNVKINYTLSKGLKKMLSN